MKKRCLALLMTLCLVLGLLPSTALTVDGEDKPGTTETGTTKIKLTASYQFGNSVTLTYGQTDSIQPSQVDNITITFRNSDTNEVVQLPVGAVTIAKVELGDGVTANVGTSKSLKFTLALDPEKGANYVLNNATVIATACATIAEANLTVSATSSKSTISMSEIATITPVYEGLVEGDSVTPTFASSNTDVATVDENGVVTPVGVGTANITVTVDAGNNYSVNYQENTVAIQVTDDSSLSDPTLTLTAVEHNTENDVTVILTPVGENLPGGGEIKVTCDDSTVWLSNYGDGTWGATLTYNNVRYEFTASYVVNNQTICSSSVSVATGPGWNITVSPDIQHGTVTVDKNKAWMGDEIAVTATPDEGYMLFGYPSAKVPDSSATYLPYHREEDDKYIFLYSSDMLHNDATVTAEFVLINPEPDPNAPAINNVNYNYDTGALSWTGTNIPATTRDNYFFVQTYTSGGDFVSSSGRECMETPDNAMHIKVTRSGNTFSCTYKPVTLANGSYKVVVAYNDYYPTPSAGYSFTVPTSSGSTNTNTNTNTSTSTSGGGDSASPSGSSVTVPVSGDQSSVKVSANVSGTTATISKIDTKQIGSVIGGDVRTGMVEIDFSGLEQTINTVNLPTASVEEIAKAAQASDNDVRGLTVKLSSGEVSFNAEALSAIETQAGTQSQITLTVAPAKTSDLNARQQEIVGSAPVFDLTMKSGGKTITSFGDGYATVSLPYTLKAGESPSGIVVYYLDNNGNIHACETTYDVRTSTVMFTTNHLSLYFVGYDGPADWENPFADVAKDAYYYDAVAWAVEQGITSGTTTTFSPNTSCTRAQMVTFLWRTAGSPTSAGTDNPFTDVQSGAYYYDAVLWAVEQGITSGTSAITFSPNATVTRGQTVTFLYRAAGSPAATGSNGFIDVEGHAYFSAVQWAVEKGVTAGTSATTFSPNNDCTRGQIVTFLYRDRAN